MIEAGDFPPPKKYGRNNRWLESDIEQWQKEQKEKHSKKSLDNSTGDKASYEQGILEQVGKFIDDLLWMETYGKMSYEGEFINV